MISNAFYESKLHIWLHASQNISVIFGFIVMYIIANTFNGENKTAFLQWEECVQLKNDTHLFVLLMLFIVVAFWNLQNNSMYFSISLNNKNSI